LRRATLSGWRAARWVDDWIGAADLVIIDGYAKTRERAGQLLRRRYERMVRDGEI
jgi:hypothetical protein